LRPLRGVNKVYLDQYTAVFEVGHNVYDLTVFKLHFGTLRVAVQLYTKGERVLRCEAIAHNAKALHCGSSLPKFPPLAAELEQILQRFLEALDCVDSAFIADDSFENLSQPGSVAQKRIAGIDLNKPRMRAVMEAVLALAASPKGFSSSATGFAPLVNPEAMKPFPKDCER
jgi:hypothetical protein